MWANIYSTAHTSLLALFLVNTFLPQCLRPAPNPVAPLHGGVQHNVINLKDKPSRAIFPGKIVSPEVLRLNCRESAAKRRYGVWGWPQKRRLIVSFFFSRKTKTGCSTKLYWTELHCQAATVFGADPETDWLVLFFSRKEPKGVALRDTVRVLGCRWLIFDGARREAVLRRLMPAQER